MNKKRLIATITSVAVVATLFAGCGKSEEAKDTKKESIKVGMVTDSGTIDDKSFNQGTWEGIKKAKDDLKLADNDIKYLKPAGETEADYMKEIGNLEDAGYKFIVTPGFKFETAIYKAQDKYKDSKFVILDGAPREKSDSKDAKIGENTISVTFAEHEAGFMAAIATAVQLKEGKVGFIGGMEIPPVQKFNWGFQQGIKYANEKLGTKIDLSADNIVYQGSFNNVAAGGQLAASMYDRGVKAIFCAAGGVGVGAIKEAKSRVSTGKDVWIVGVDSDQFKDGEYKSGKSVVLTSAVKKIDNATADLVKKASDGKFDGGKALVYDAKNDGVGIPKENPNLSSETKKTCDDILAKLKSGDIKVAGEKGDLIK